MKRCQFERNLEASSVLVDVNQSIGSPAKSN